MALTRKFLAALGIEEAKVDEIIAAHSETVDALKKERDGYKADADKLGEVQKELDSLKLANEKDPYKVKYEAVKEDFDNFKKETEAKQAADAKEKAYRAMLQKIGVADKRLDAVMRVTDLSKVELDDKGELKDAETLEKSAGTEWADFIVKKTEKGAETDKPPAKNGGGTMTKADIMKISDRAERRKAMLDHPEAFSQLSDLKKD